LVFQSIPAYAVWLQTRFRKSAAHKTIYKWSLLSLLLQDNGKARRWCEVQIQTNDLFQLLEESPALALTARFFAPSWLSNGITLLLRSKSLQISGIGGTVLTLSGANWGVKK